MNIRDAFVASRHFAKRLVFRLLPARLQEEIDFHFYLRRLRAGTQAPESELRILHHFVQPGSIALDVGANLGAYAVALSDLVGASGDVHAFEPVPRTFRLLQRSAARLGKRVQVHCVGISSRVGESTFYVPLEGSLENFYVASLLRPSTKSLQLTIKTTTLDTWRQTHVGRRVSFLKIDAEGVEFDVLSGARALIAADQPIVLCEISDGPESERDRNVFALMKQLGYASVQHTNGRLVARADSQNREGPNYIFIPSAELDRFRALIG